MTDTRTEILDHVRAHPGVHFNELVRGLALAPGQVQYHVRRLLGDDLVAEPLYGRTHYFTPEYDADERGTLALLRRETARDVVVFLIGEGPSTPGAVADDLDVARSTLAWHVDHLVEQGVVEKVHADDNRVTLELVDPAGTAALLREVSPSLPGRMVDRFTRLFDRLAEE